MEPYADILFPLALENPLSYRIPGDLGCDLAIGRQVQAPIGKRTYTGVVWQLRHNEAKPFPGEALKDISKVEKSLPIVPEQTLRFWEWIARYYMCPLGTVAKMALSLWKFKRRALFTGTDTFNPPMAGKPMYVKDIQRIDQYGKHLQAITAAGGQCLILSPDKAACEKMYESLFPAYGQTLLCFHSKRTLKEQSRTLKELYAGNPCIICGMHHALFLPFTRLGLIIVDMEEHPGHKKQDAAPYLHNRDTALMMGQMSQAKVILGSALPSLETYYNLEQGKFEYLSLKPETSFSWEHLTIIDTVKSMKNNSMKGLLDIRISLAAREVLDRGKEVLLVESDSDFMEDAPQDPGIKVCRPYQMHHYLDQKTGLICFLHTDRLLSRKHFRATEQTLHLTAQALLWGAAQKPVVPVFLQTSDTDHPLYGWLRDGSPSETLSHLLEERKHYGYPPHKRMITLTVSHYRKNTARIKASEMAENIIKANFPARVEGPFSPVGNRRILFAYRIQLIIPRTIKAQAIKDKLSEILLRNSCAPAQCRIDVDPA